MRKLLSLVVALATVVALLAFSSAANASTHHRHHSRAHTAMLHSVVPEGLPMHNAGKAWRVLRARAQADPAIASKLAATAGASSFNARDFRAVGYSHGAPDSSNSGLSDAGTLEPSQDTSHCNKTSRMLVLIHVETHAKVFVCTACANPRLFVRRPPAFHRFSKGTVMKYNKTVSKWFKICPKGQRVRIKVTVHIKGKLRARTWGKLQGRLESKLAAAFKAKVQLKIQAKCPKPAPKPVVTPVVPLVSNNITIVNNNSQQQQQGQQQQQCQVGEVFNESTGKCEQQQTQVVCQNGQVVIAPETCPVVTPTPTPTPSPSPTPTPTPPPKAHAWLIKKAYLDNNLVTLSGGEFTFTVSVNGSQVNTVTNAASGSSRDLGEFDGGDVVKVCESDSNGYTPDTVCITHTMEAGKNFTFPFVNRKTTPPPPPTGECTGLTFSHADLSATVTIGISTTNGASFKSATVNWGDSHSTTDGLTQSHTYAAAGSYAVNAVVTFNLPNGQTSKDDCSGSVTVTSPPPPSHFTNISCTGFEEISGGGSFLVDCDVSNDNGAVITLSAHSNDSNSRVSGINCYSQGGTPSCQGNGTFEFRVSGINDGSSVVYSSITVTASSNGVDKTWTSDPFPVDPSGGGF